MTPKSEALAFRIWAYCEPRGWDVTAGEIGTALGVSSRHVGRVVKAKGWGTRIRAHVDFRHRVNANRITERLDFLGKDFGFFADRLDRQLSDLANYT